MKISRKTGPTDEELPWAVPPASSGREVRIGIFVLIGFVSFLLILFLLTDPATFRGRYMVMTEVDDAGGIRRGDPVQMRGVNIGRVHRFEMTPEGVRVTLEIEGVWEIPEDSRARLVSSGLLGGRTVDVVRGTSEVAVRREGSIPGEKVEGVFDIADDLGGQAGDVMSQVALLLADPTVESIKAGAEDLRALLSDLSDVAAAQKGEIGRFTATLNRSAEGIEELVTGPEIASAAVRLDETLLRLSATTSSLDRTIGTLQSLLDRIDRGEGTLGMLATNDSLYRNLNLAAESVSSLARDFQEHPERYIRIRFF